MEAAAVKKPAVKKPAAKKPAAKKPAVKNTAAKKSAATKSAPVPVAKKRRKKAAKKPARATLSKGGASASELAKGNAARKAAARAKSEARKAPALISKQSKSAKKITKAQAKRYEATLLRIRDELSRQIAFLRGTSLTRADEVNTQEDGSDAFERQLALKLAANEGDAIFEIDEALERLRNGEYAICEDCGCIIGAPRLQALPFARRCVGCKSLSEKTSDYQQRRFL